MNPLLTIKKIINAINWMIVFRYAFLTSLICILIANTLFQDPTFLIVSLSCFVLLVLAAIIYVTMDEIRDRKNFRS